jgi:predicted dehydrogenase
MKIKRAGKRELKVVLAGCGGMSGAWLKPLTALPGVRVAGLVDLRAESARKRAEEFGLADAVVGTKLAEVLKKTQPDIVCDCTVPEAHMAVTLEALKHGCHVLGEKPLADSMPNARKMLAAARKAGRLYAVMQNRRHNAQIRRLREFLDSGVIGKVHTAHCDFFVGAHFGGFRDKMRHVLLLDMAIHTFDAARFLTRADATAVCCKEWNPVSSWYAHGASAVGIFEMTGGLVYTYRGSWCAEGLHTSWESAWRLIGDKGTVLWNGAEEIQAQSVTKSGSFFSEVRASSAPALPEPERYRGHASLIEDFIACVRTGREPETAASDNIKSLAMVFGAIESADRREWVAIKT